MDVAKPPLEEKPEGEPEAATEQKADAGEQVQEPEVDLQAKFFEVMRLAELDPAGMRAAVEQFQAKELGGDSAE